MTAPPEPPRFSLWHTARPVAVIILVVLAGVGVVSSARWLGERVGAGIQRSEEEATVDVEPGHDVTVEIPEGASASRIAEILAEAGVVRSAGQFEAAARTSRLAESLRAGRYELITGMTPDEVLEVLSRGPVVIVFDVTIREGLRVSEIIEELSAISGIPATEFEEALLEGEVTTSLHEIPEEPTLADWEGLLFPDTYRFSERARAADMLGRLAATMEQRMDSVDWAALESSGFTQYEGIILASLIESEVRVPDERPLVSSVMRNRFAAGERLDIDATILYALGTRDPSLIDVELDSPYNTRRFPGLPPTPISAPGLASLEAAAAPADTDFLFYVLSSPDGTHTFSTTLEEHNAAVAKARADGVIP